MVTPTQLRCSFVSTSTLNRVPTHTQEKLQLTRERKYFLIEISFFTKAIAQRKKRIEIRKYFLSREGHLFSSRVDEIEGYWQQMILFEGWKSSFSSLSEEIDISTRERKYFLIEISFFTRAIARGKKGIEIKKSFL